MAKGTIWIILGKSTSIQIFIWENVMSNSNTTKIRWNRFPQTFNDGPNLSQGTIGKIYEGSKQFHAKVNHSRPWN